LQVIIDFPPTDAITRYQIWTRVFPSETQIANDIDFQELAQQIQLSGSTIKSIAIASAYLAASEGKAINRQHIDAAAEQECKKVGRTPPPKKIEARS
jgi:ATP-dependent 26S proteasome regulatory subunit